MKFVCKTLGAAAIGAILAGSGCAPVLRQFGTGLSSSVSVEKIVPCEGNATELVQSAIDKAFLSGGGGNPLVLSV